MWYLYQSIVYHIVNGKIFIMYFNKCIIFHNFEKIFKKSEPSIKMIRLTDEKRKGKCKMAIIQIKSKKDKEQKFTELIEENKLRFYKTAKVILKNDDDIYDAIQDALISMYRSYEQLENKEYFSTWATRIVINKCYDLLRKNRNNVVAIDEKVENDMNMAQYDKYEVDEYGIKEAMKYLNEDFKLIVVLYYYNNYSIKEISQIVNIPEGTVKSRLSKAREILRQKLEKEEI